MKEYFCTLLTNTKAYTMRRDKKIKTEHHILSEFHTIIKTIANLLPVQKIIPWRINRKQKGSSHMAMTYSYDTASGLKYIIKKWSTAQEIFIICQIQDKEIIKESLQDLIKHNKL